MILGTWGAGWAGYQWGWGAAVVGGLVFGAVGGLLHARRHGHLRRGPRRLRRGDQHPRRRHRPVPLRAPLRRQPGRGGAAQSPPLSSRPPDFSLPVLSSGPDLLGCGRGPALVPRQRPRRAAARADQRGRRPHPDRRADDPGGLPDPVADGVRPAAAVLRGEPGRRRLARRAGVPAEVHRRAHLGCPRRAGRRVPGLHRQHLPRGPDRRPRLHRPRRADLRQLASGRPGGGAGCSASPTPCSCAAGRRSSPCCCWWRCCSRWSRSGRRCAAGSWSRGSPGSSRERRWSATWRSTGCPRASSSSPPT